VCKGNVADMGYGTYRCRPGIVFYEYGTGTEYEDETADMTGHGPRTGYGHNWSDVGSCRMSDGGFLLCFVFAYRYNANGGEVGMRPEFGNWILANIQLTTPR
jgi:hypothetical protein